MVKESFTRRLAAIVVADVVGYSRLMESDEAGTLATLKDRRTLILQPMVRARGGRIVKLMGDGVLIEFASAVNAVSAAIELQRKMSEANTDLPDRRRIVLRIGINLGDVIGEGADIYGEGVNIAARLETLAEPGGICISGKVHDEVRGKVDAAFEDAGERQLKNISTPVRVYHCGPSVEPMATQTISPVSNKPSIAILPLDNLSGDPGQKYLSDGITEDIITELSRFKNLSVAARHASFQLGGKGLAVRAARDLGVNFVVEGSVRKTGERIRITVQLIDADTGNHVWAERFDRETHDIFAVQDEVVSAIVATLEGHMMSTAVAQLRKKPTSSWTAYDFFMRGREVARRASDREAAPFFARAISIDPGFAQAHAWLAIGHLGSYWADADSSTLEEARLAAQRALELDSNDAAVQQANAMVALWLGQHERASMHFNRAVDLNPADAEIRADRAEGMRFAGQPEQALIEIDDALQRSKFSPNWFWWIRGGILIDLERYDEAIAALGNIAQKEYGAWLQLAAAHAQLGHASEAAHALAMGRKLKPNLSLRDVVAMSPYAHREAGDPLFNGLRKAGLAA
ncbi:MULTISPECIES: adenylate/guanylate cyclase domain-containing protein [unclassified Mesorhizobium]|uniref:adenylate/guanylate cyclase domain-containing protein n=1 Tax=unclassified Mesorhizobium TaxID=325217 RepID=UPI0003CEB9A4|nr:MULTISPECIES: adenylate/guanylate cyclase domain-containing protein [unclassified Mesorhizobium]ESY17891.1 adenylate cyclase [Mesorhizobium sp. LNJC395A00]WJI73795.1 adenylate/guanylate cyclase domain-containing protein [Mesorhizobium sp. C395A]